MLVRVAVVSALLGFLPACKICQPGKVQECVYLKGQCAQKAVQQCNKEGTQWESCECPAAPAETTAAPAAASAPAPEPDAPPSPPASGKTASQIGGKSLSDVDIATLKASLEKAGYATIGPEEIVTCGDVETIQLSLARKGKPVGVISLQRPAAKPDDCKATPVKEAYEKWKPSADGAQSKNAVMLDEAAGVLLAINLLKDEPGAAKKLMDALLTK